jgi:ABC-type polysaccharide/polyol phosphate transport system ATPase subunit/acylphosphatase
VGILGRNGAGKSTLLDIIAGIRQPTTGTVKVNGRLIALAGMGAGFNKEFTGRENVMLNGLILGMERREILKRFEDIAALADIGDFMDQQLKTYSSGMRSRLGFAVAANVEPDVLILDETLAVGDAVYKQTALRKMYELRDSGTTILFVSHSAKMVKEFCTQAILLHEGRLLEFGEVTQVIDRYQNLVSSAKTQGNRQSEDGKQPPNNGWHNWRNSLGGTLTTGPVVARNADGRLEVFARGTDNALWHIRQTSPNNGWSGWSSLGRALTTDPVVARNADGRLEVFVRGTDTALWHIWQTSPNNGWSDWNFLKGVLTSKPVVARNADGRLEVFMRGTDNALWHKWQTSPKHSVILDEEGKSLEDPTFKEDRAFARRVAHLRSGTGEARIQGVELYDEYLRQVDTVASGSTVIVRVYLEYLEAVKDSELIVALRDEAGSGQTQGQESQFYGPNLGYVLELYERYREDPKSVDERTRDFFETWSPPWVEANGHAPAVAGELFSASTPLEVGSLEMEKGERVVVDFTFKVPLREGRYSISAGVRASGEDTYLDRVDVATTLRIEYPQDRRPCRGVVHLPTEIKVHAPGGERQGRSA